MADKKISELTAITGADTAADDYFIVVDTSGSATKKISRAELNNAIEQDVLENISITNLTSDLSTNGNDINFGDNDKAIFGAGSDLQIYHDGSNSYVRDGGTGNLVVEAQDFKLRNVGSTENLLTAGVNSSVNLYYDALVKLSTTSGGIDVTGTVTADGLTVSNTIVSSPSSNTGRIVFGDNASTNYVGVYRGTITGAATGDNYLNLGGYSGVGVFSSGTTVGSQTRRALFANSGDISFYDSTGVSQGFFWDASAQRLGLGTTSPITNLDIAGASATSLTVRNTGTVSSIVLSNDSTANTIYSRGVNATTGRDLRFYQGSSEAVRITSGGNVGIGTISPDPGVFGLHIHNPSSNFSSLKLSNSATGSTSGDGSSLQIDGSGNLRLRNFENTYMTFETNNTEAARIDSSGNVLCGSDGGGDIGSSTRRFSDLYLSGGVYLGGTGSANLLDDYEEGTWDVSLRDGTGVVDTHTTSGRYVKSGSMVYATAAIFGGSGFTASGNVKINLPFAAGVTQVNVSSPTTYVVDAAGIEAVYIVDGASHCNFSTDITNGNKLTNVVTTGAVFGSTTKRLYFGIVYSTA